MIEIVWAVALAAYAILIPVGIEAMKAGHARAAYISFSAAAMLLGGADVMWAVTTEQSLLARIFISGAVGAIVLVGLAEGLRYVGRSSAETESKHSDPGSKAPMTSGKNSPSFTAGGDMILNNPHFGDVYNFGTQPRRITNEQQSLFIQATTLPGDQKFEIMIRQNDGSPEGSAFLEKIVNLLAKTSSLAPRAQIGMSGTLGNLQGLILEVRDPANLSPKAKVIMRGLAAAKIPFSLGGPTPAGWPADEVRLVVGSAPLE